MSKEPPLKLTIKLPRQQVQRLRLLQQALSEKMNKQLELSDLVEKIIDDFLSAS